MKELIKHIYEEPMNNFLFEILVFLIIVVACVILVDILARKVFKVK